DAGDRKRCRYRRHRCEELSLGEFHRHDLLKLMSRCDERDSIVTKANEKRLASEALQAPRHSQGVSHWGE
ncbi:MAG: hypothetical protein EBT99_10190, partial [Betaproteobacteria bacterium]|nr:hypothetical protein [Betaproteobacteria bacterium]